MAIPSKYKKARAIYTKRQMVYRRKWLVERQSGKCTRCLAVMVDNPTTEHFVPVSQGGPRNAHNEVAMCSACNHHLDCLPVVDKIEDIVDERLRLRNRQQRQRRRRHLPRFITLKTQKLISQQPVWVRWLVQAFGRKAGA